MKRWMGWLLCLLAFGQVRAAGNEWLDRLQRAVEALGAYEVQFDISAMNDYATTGFYRVDGERYWMEMPDMRVYCDGKARYEINDRTEEVVIDAVQTQSRNLLDNPVRAFDFVGEQYAVEQLAETAEHPGQVTLRLTPRSAAGAAGATIDLTIDKRTALPVMVIYAAEDVQIRVRISSFAKSSTAFPAFRKADFPDYEWIDFR